jgi:hypothetical protein
MFMDRSSVAVIWPLQAQASVRKNCFRSGIRGKATYVITQFQGVITECELRPAVAAARFDPRAQARDIVMKKGA